MTEFQVYPNLKGISLYPVPVVSLGSTQSIPWDSHVKETRLFFGKLGLTPEKNKSGRGSGFVWTLKEGLSANQVTNPSKTTWLQYNQMNQVFVTGSTARAKMLPVPQIPGIVTIEPKVANPFRQQKRLGQKPVMSSMLWVTLLELL